MRKLIFGLFVFFGKAAKGILFYSFKFWMKYFVFWAKQWKRILSDREALLETFIFSVCWATYCHFYANPGPIGKIGQKESRLQRVARRSDEIGESVGGEKEQTGKLFAFLDRRKAGKKWEGEGRASTESSKILSNNTSIQSGSSSPTRVVQRRESSGSREFSVTQTEDDLSPLSDNEDQEIVRTSSEDGPRKRAITTIKRQASDASSLTPSDLLPSNYITHVVQRPLGETSGSSAGNLESSLTPEDITSENVADSGNSGTGVGTSSSSENQRSVGEEASVRNVSKQNVSTGTIGAASKKYSKEALTQSLADSYNSMAESNKHVNIKKRAKNYRTKNKGEKHDKSKNPQNRPLVDVNSAITNVFKKTFIHSKFFQNSSVRRPSSSVIGQRVYSMSHYFDIDPLLAIYYKVVGRSIDFGGPEFDYLRPYYRGFMHYFMDQRASRHRAIFDGWNFNLRLKYQ